MRPRRPNLGERLAAVERIRSGRATVAEVAAFYAVTPADVESWQRAHADDRTVSLEEIRNEIGGEPVRLMRKAQRLRDLISLTDRTLHILHARLIIKSIP
jgi:hypothetical protein